jgi:hypothetical protein
VPGCGRLSDEGGFCEPHYRAWKRSGSPADRDQWAKGYAGTVGLPRAQATFPANRSEDKRQRQCRVDQCPDPPAAKGLCHMHYSRWQSCGRPSITTWLAAGAPTRSAWSIELRKDAPMPSPSPNAKVCRVDGCEKKTVAQDLCGTHHARWTNCNKPPLDDWLRHGGPTPTTWAKRPRNPRHQPGAADTDDDGERPELPADTGDDRDMVPDEPAETAEDNATMVGLGGSGEDTAPPTDGDQPADGDPVEASVNIGEGERLAHAASDMEADGIEHGVVSQQQTRDQAAAVVHPIASGVPSIDQSLAKLAQHTRSLRYYAWLCDRGELNDRPARYRDQADKLDAIAFDIEAAVTRELNQQSERAAP